MAATLPTIGDTPGCHANLRIGAGYDGGSTSFDAAGYGALCGDLTVDGAVDVGGALGVGGAVTVAGAMALAAAQTLANVAADATGQVLSFTKKRATAIVQSGDQLGKVSFQGWNGTSFDTAAYIDGICDGTPGATTDMPGALRFYVTPDGSATAALALKIGQDKLAAFAGAMTIAGALGVTGLLTASGKINCAAGTAAAPAIYLNGDSDTGLYYPAANMLGLSVSEKTHTVFRYDNNNFAVHHFDSEENSGGFQTICRKSRASATVQNNDTLCQIVAQGYDGSAYRNSSYIGMCVGGTPGAADMPGTVIIGVSADGSAYMTERLRIACTGYLSVPGVYNQTSGSAANVVVDSSGNLMRSTSGEQFKTDIADLDENILEKVLELKPRSYRSVEDEERAVRNRAMRIQLAEKYLDYATKSGSAKDLQRAQEELSAARAEAAKPVAQKQYFGLVAQEVAAVLPELVTFDEKGEPDSVAYERVAVLLLGEVKKLKERIEKIEEKPK